jgi:hypothetical protein
LCSEASRTFGLTFPRTRQRGVGKASGAPVEIEVTFVCEFRGNQVARIDEYDTLEEALEAARLRE